MVVWIVGHEYIAGAQARASQRPYSPNLGLDPSLFKVCWLSSVGLKLDGLVNLLLSQRQFFPHPDIMIIHSFGNDLGTRSTLNLLANIMQFFSFLRFSFPRVVPIFSEIIPRLIWSSLKLSFLNKIRKRVNRNMAVFLPSIGGFSFRHLDLEGFLPGLFNWDQLLLSDIGYDILNANLQEMVEKASRLVGVGHAC